jgi:hypothetical protein
LLKDGQPSIGIFADEGGLFIGGHGMNTDNKLKTASGLSSVWDGSPIKRVRQGDGASILAGKRVSMHLMVQPDVAWMMLSDQLLLDQGLLSRFLVCYPPSTAGSRFWQDMDEHDTIVLQDFSQQLLTIMRRPMPLATGKLNELDPPLVNLSQEAKALWVNFVNHIETELAPHGSLEIIKGFANKLPEHAVRLAAVICLIEGHATEISGATMAQGIELAQYYASELLRLAFYGGADPKLVQAQALLNWLQSKWNESVVSLPDIYQKGPKAIRDAKTAKSLVDILVDHGWLIEVPEGATINGNYRKQAWSLQSQADE